LHYRVIVISQTFSTTPCSRRFRSYASTSSTQPGPFDYEYKNESEGTKTLIIPYTEGHAEVVLAIKGSEPGSAFRLDVWIDVFEGVTAYDIALSETTPPGTLVCVNQPSARRSY
jgi:hypothetical protein